MTNTMQTYARFPVSFTKGEGVYLTDTKGDSYLDALGGIAVCALGHSHPDIAKAIADQASTLTHTSNLYGIDLQDKLSKKLAEISGLETTFFANSGAEANEAAIKLAKMWAYKKGVINPIIITMNGAFHGRTMGTLSATPKKAIQKGFEPLLPNFIHIDYDDISQVKEALLEHDNVCAVMLEPIQGENGVVVPEEGYLEAIRFLCDQNDALMICDEVQTGIGRTGKWFAYQHENILPDIVTSAKALGNGMPIGACIAGKKVSDTLGPGSHGSTFGGNPLACRAALEVIDVIEKQKLITRADEIGQYLLTQLDEKLADNDSVIEIRGMGCMIGIEFDEDCSFAVQEALNQKLLLLVSSQTTLRLLPAYITSNEELDKIIDVVVNIANKIQEQ